MAKEQHKSIFRGGDEGVKLSNCNYVEVNGLSFEKQNFNGLNFDDGGSHTIPSTHITVRNCTFKDIRFLGDYYNLMKVSGVDHFLVENCVFTNGSKQGAGIDLLVVIMLLFKTMFLIIQVKKGF